MKGWIYTNEWAAGFFDGEGCIRVETHKGNPGPIDVSVSQKELAPLTELHARFGGHISPTRKGQFACYRWRVRSQRAVAFLRAVYPWLLVKRLQADLAFDYAEIMGAPRSNIRARVGRLAERRDIQRRISEAKRR